MACTDIVTSEIYNEKGYFSTKIKNNSKNVIAKFKFNFPLIDKDGDLIVKRKKDDNLCEQCIEIEHSLESNLKLVGLQVWRGALLLSDLILNLGANYFENKTVLELGSGVGLTSIVASKFAKNVICSDIDLGNILKVIHSNFVRNKAHVKSEYSVTGLDFFSTQWSDKLEKLLTDVNIILSADVVYDNDITDAFIKTIERLLDQKPAKEIYIGLEKRFVFTISELDSVAPCYEHFVLRLTEMLARNKDKLWCACQMDVNFPKYFDYDRVSQLVLWKITS